MHGEQIEEGQEWRWMTKELAILEVQEEDRGRQRKTVDSD